MNRRLLIAALLALFGSGIACSKADTPTSPSPTPTEGPIFYTAIGASDGIGFGSSAPCLPFTDCPDGAGYVQILRRRLRDAFPGRTVEYQNLSVPGAVLSKAIQDLARDIGRNVDLAGNFIERESLFVSANTTHVTLFAGGNDANVIGNAVLAGRANSSDPSAYIDAQVRQWGIDLEDLVTRIRSRAPNARIVALNMINLAGAPYLASRPTSEKSIMQRIAVGISDRVNALTAKNVLVVDLMCDARLYLPQNYAADGFHPGDGGYTVFADDSFPSLKDGTNNQPNTGCAQRRIIP